MSNPQWPGQGNQSNSPWANQDPNWHPQDFRDVPGRDPRQPFGQPTSSGGQQPSWEPEPPRRNNSKLWIVAGAIVVIVAIVVGMQFLAGPPSEPAASESAAASSAAPSPTRTGNYIPFEGNGDGVFEIVSYSWSGIDRLDLRIRVEVDQGQASFGLFAFTNETRASYDPLDPRTFSASEDSPYEGDVTFIMPKADSSIVLTTPSGRIALNALPISG